MTSRSRSPSLRRTLLAVIGLLALAAGLRVAVWRAVEPVTPLGDEMYYVLTAANIADGLGHVYGRNARALRPPAHPWVLSLVAEPGAIVRPASAGQRRGVRVEGLAPLVWEQIAIGCLLVLATIALGAALFDRRVGLVAGGLAAFYPTFIAYSHYLWSENLFALLVTAALAALVADAAGKGAIWPIAAGLLFGAAALTREIALPVAFAALAWRIHFAGEGDRRRAGIRAALVLALALLAIVPWALRNHRELGRILPISSVGWIAIAEGNSLEGARWLRPAAPGRSEFRAEVLAIEDETRRIDFARARTWAVISADPLGWALHKLAYNVPLLFSPDAFQLYKLRNGSYGPVAAWKAAGVTAATIASYAAVMVLAFFGIAAADPRRRALALWVGAVVLAVHVFANANSRFRMPWMPLAMVYAAFALVAGVRGMRALPRRPLLLAGAASAFVFALCAAFPFLD